MSWTNLFYELQKFILVFCSLSLLSLKYLFSYCFIFLSCVLPSGSVQGEIHAMTSLEISTHCIPTCQLPEKKYYSCREGENCLLFHHLTLSLCLGTNFHKNGRTVKVFQNFSSSSKFGWGFSSVKYTHLCFAKHMLLRRYISDVSKLNIVLMWKGFE